MVSVIMSVYNGSNFLDKCILSVLNQSLNNFEFIIYNDGSTDNTLDILEKYSNIDRRIKIYSTKNIGLTRCLIKAIGQTKYPFLARIDADDEMHPERLEKQSNYLKENPDIGLLFTSLDIIDKHNNKLRTVNYNLYSKLFIKKRLFFSNIIVHGSTMYRKKIYEHIGGYCKYFKYSQDYDLWLRFSLASKIGFLNQPLYLLRLHNNSISSKKTVDQLEYASLGLFRNLKKIKCDDLEKFHKKNFSDLNFIKIKFRFALIRSDLKLMNKYLINLNLYYKFLFFFLKSLIFLKKNLK